MRTLSRTHSPRRNGSRAKSLQFEPLECRQLLAIVVNTAVDEFDESISDGDISLRDALFLASPNDRIEFDSALDGKSIQIALGELKITKPLVIDARALTAGLTLDATSADPTPTQNNGDGIRAMNIRVCAAADIVEVHGLTFRGGDVNGHGGAILSCGNLVLSHVSVIDNSSVGDFSFQTSGGGITVERNLVIEESLIEGNFNNRGTGGGISVGGKLQMRASRVLDNVVDSGSGGGVWAENAAISGSTLSRNRSGNGAALAGQTFEVRDSLVSENEVLSAAGGGAISGINVSIHSSVVTGNTMLAARGTGAGVYGLDVWITRSLISGNSIRAAEALGGGVAGTTLLIESSTIANNSATGAFGLGGGVHGQQVTILSSTISGNRVGSNTANGGGVYSDRLTISHSTVYDNLAEATEGVGGGIYINGDSLISNHSIIAGNRAIAGNSDQFPAPDVSMMKGNIDIQFTLVGDRSGSILPKPPATGPDARGNLIGDNASAKVDPQLGPLALNGGPLLPGGRLPTHMPQQGSPVVNGGASTLENAPEFDQRGEPYVRRFGDRIDIGAIERQRSPGDVNGDDQVDAQDIDAICAAVGQDSLELHDVTRDGKIDTADVDFVVEGILHTSLGDVNLDGKFDSTDLVLVFQRGVYEDDVNGNGLWSSGDWNCDGDFNSSDLILAFERDEYRD